MDKPQSLSIKDWLVRKLSVKMMLSEKLIDTVVTHQFSEANIALSTNHSVEISGFGKFYFNNKKAHKTMEKLLSKEKMFQAILDDHTISEQKRISTQNKLTNTIAAIIILKPKLHELLTDLRGVEEQPDSTI